MIVGVLKEIKDNENRVALTPAGAKELVARGHKVLVEKDAGKGSGFHNSEYKDAGAEIITDPREISQIAELVLKIKEPIKDEHKFFKENQIIFTYFHFASSEELTKNMLESKAICVAYETVQTDDGRLPLLAPMSEVAGKMSVVVGSNYLAKYNNGKGILISGVTGVEPAKVVVIGAGVVGTGAAKVAAGMGAKVIILDINEERLKQLEETIPGDVTGVKSTPEAVAEYVKQADILVGAVLLPGAKAPKLVTKEMVESMEAGSVIVDVAIDQGGCVETAKPTSHSFPVYDINGVIHYCVTNMPGAYPRTSSFAITNATLPYVLEIADKGMKAFDENKALAKGINIHNGVVTNKGVAEAWNLKYTPLKEVLKATVKEAVK